VNVERLHGEPLEVDDVGAPGAARVGEHLRHVIEKAARDELDVGAGTGERRGERVVVRGRERRRVD
jgi:hypothetical protein